MTAFDNSRFNWIENVTSAQALVALVWIHHWVGVPAVSFKNFPSQKASLYIPKIANLSCK